jgi:transcriptional regulator with XRE-family HTH domain
MKIENFSANLKALVESSGMTRREFGEKIGICDATLSRLMQGHNVPSIKTVLSLVVAFDIPWEKLFKKQGE